MEKKGAMFFPLTTAEKLRGNCQLHRNFQQKARCERGPRSCVLNRELPSEDPKLLSDLKNVSFLKIF